MITISYPKKEAKVTAVGHLLEFNTQWPTFTAPIAKFMGVPVQSPTGETIYSITFSTHEVVKMERTEILKKMFDGPVKITLLVEPL